MTIDFSCDCGKRYRVNEVMAGRTTRCKGCGRVVRVPELLKEEETFDAVDEAPASLAVDTAAPRIDPAVRKYLEPVHGTVASNPGQLRVDVLHYFTCFPEGPIVYGATLVLGPLAAIKLGFVAPANRRRRSARRRARSSRSPQGRRSRSCGEAAGSARRCLSGRGTRLM